MCPTTNDEQSAQLCDERKFWRFVCRDVGAKNTAKNEARIAIVAGEG
jgi:hypothetical protein